MDRALPDLGPYFSCLPGLAVYLSSAVFSSIKELMIAKNNCGVLESLYNSTRKIL